MKLYSPLLVEIEKIMCCELEDFGSFQLHAQLDKDETICVQFDNSYTDICAADMTQDSNDYILTIKTVDWSKC
jgi:hypothetical protein